MDKKTLSSCPTPLFRFIAALGLTIALQTKTQAQVCDSSQLAMESSPQQATLFAGEKIKAASDQLMNSFYGNPQASSLPPYEVLKRGELKGYDRRRNEVSKGMNAFVETLIEARRSQYYIQCPGDSKRRNQCRDRCDVPPAYIWGGMGWYESNPQGGIVYNPFQNFEHTNQLTGLPGLDCSGLVHSIYSLVGLRVNRDLKKKVDAEAADNTPARTYLNTDTDSSCFTEIPPLAAELRLGDLIAWRTHILLVDSIGPDPFGINSIQKAEDCKIKNLRPSQATLIGMNSKGGFDFPAAEVEAEFLENTDYAQALFQKMLMHNQFAATQKLQGKGLLVQPFDGERLMKVRQFISDAKATQIERLVLEQNLQLTGVGVGISKMKYGELMLSAPQPLFGLSLRACRAKFAIREATVADTNRAKVVRHLASEGRAPCACLSAEKEKIILLQEIPQATANIYCAKSPL